MQISYLADSPDAATALIPGLLEHWRHITPEQTADEVAETSLAADREKAELYAAGGIAEYWIVDVVDDLIEVRTDVVDGAYTRVTPYRRGQTLTPLSFPDTSLRVDDVFG